MKKLFTLFLIVLGLSLMSTDKANASHGQGGEITYTYVGSPSNPYDFLVTFRFYRDCAGIPAPSSATVCYSSASLGVSQTSTIYPIAGTGNPIPQSSCVSVPGNCAGGVGTEEWIYQGVITLTGPATDWIFSYETCCRNGAITTLTNASSLGFYVFTTLDNLNFPTNSSPYFDSVPVTTFCVNNQFYYFQGAHDPNNDSLHYSLVSALDATGFCPYTPTNLPYNSPFSPTNPIATANGTSIDPNTGVVSFIPNQVQVAVLCVLVEEFDTTQFPAVKKGETRRDMQILVINNCVVVQPAPTGLGSALGYNNAIFANCADTSVIVQLSDKVQCGSVAVDGSDFRAIRPNGQPNPIFHAEPVNCSNGKCDSVRVFFYYPLTQTRTALYIKKGTDGNTMLSECGNSIYETNGADTISINDTINILIQDTSVIDLKLPVVTPCVFKQFTIHFYDQILCSTIRSNASDFKLVDATGTQFPLVTAYGACSGATPLSPGSNTQDITLVAQQPVVGISPFYVISLKGNDNNTIANICETYINVGDTIAILDASAPLQMSLGADITQCTNDPAPVLNAQIPGVSYIWYYNGAVLPDTTQFLIATQAGAYSVAVSASPTCNGGDTMNLALVQAPVATILANGVSTNVVTICTGTPYPALDGTVAGATSYNWTLNGTSVATSATYTPTADGTYILQVAAAAGSSVCSNTDTITINTVSQIVVNLGAPVTQCANLPAPTLDAGVFPGANYLWSTGATTQTISPTVSGNYAVTVTYGVNCSASSSVAVTINAVPASPALADQSICYNVAIGILNANPFGAQPPSATYTWSNGTSTVGTGSTYTPTAAGTYTVTIDNAGCTINDDAVVNIEAQLPLTISGPATICGAPATLDAGLAGQVTSYAWSNGTSVIGNTQTIAVTGGGTYSVVTTTALGCTAAASFAVTPGTFATTIVGDNVICETSSAPLNAGYTGTATATYAWTLNNAPTAGNTNIITATQAGTYGVVITDQYGCTANDTATLAVEKILPAPLPTCMASSNGTFKYIYTWTAITGNQGYEVSLDGGVTWIAPNTPTTPESHGVATPATTFIVHALGDYCPTGKNSEPAPCEVVIPNVVTPNGDGKNDVFHIINVEQYKGVKLQIFNRWGNVIYSSDDYNAHNDYSFKNDADGTYFYVLNIPDQEGKSGTITVVREKK